MLERMYSANEPGWGYNNRLIESIQHLMSVWLVCLIGLSDWSVWLVCVIGLCDWSVWLVCRGVKQKRKTKRGSSPTSFCFAGWKVNPNA
jgi:hypothetical protein